MINLCKFARMSFTEIISLPNYYIHEIYKLYVEDSIARAKRDELEKKQREARERQSAIQEARRDSADVQSLRQLLTNQGGLENDDLEELIEELE